MLKKFIAMKTPLDRFEMFDDSKLAEWTEAELNAIANIVNVTFEKNADKAAKYMVLHYELYNRKKLAA
jgi:hypothetical protein